MPIATFEGELVYLDASALVKRVRDEPESRALRRSLEASAIASSELVLAEVPQVVRRRSLDWSRSSRRAAAANAERALEDVDFVPLDRQLLLDAGWLVDPRLRALDAIHLISALKLAKGLAAFVSYDRRQVAAAEAAGLPVASPA